MMQEATENPKRALIAAVQLPGVSDAEFEASLSELRQLAKTLGFEVVGTFTQKRSRFDAAAYLGVGKRQEIRRFALNEAEADAAQSIAAESEEAEDEMREDSGHEDRCEYEADDPFFRSPVEPNARRADFVLVDHEISPSQARTLEKESGCEVMDRTMVILEIFHRHARSRAARAQVEIARLQYMAPRLREQAKLVGPQGRQRSGTGGRGAGEKVMDLDRQKIRDRIAELKRQIEQMDLERKTQRARRQDSQARVALVGYTNAGKSTLMRALTGNEALVADKLFATLDTTVRALQPETTPRMLVSDTVGFIKNLPHDLVASFKSTLDEALEASLLAHVIDASDPGFERQLAVTEHVLDEIGAEAVPRLLIFNKIDRIGIGADQAEREATLLAQYPGCIVMSARREGDIARLRAAMTAFFEKDLVEGELFLPWSAQRLRGEIFSNCVVLEERAEDGGIFFRVRGEGKVLHRLREQLGTAHGA